MNIILYRIQYQTGKPPSSANLGQIDKPSFRNFKIKALVIIKTAVMVIILFNSIGILLIYVMFKANSTA